ncbi:hypothetical protein Pcinc_023632 [Petrolisthes cinctipes]|uniref:Uncharacterized protein n=1 Tax=Petrolisthes cinctipes TaxID=88211 RepID=A0AAE1KEX1_PETCI|nr:hypothetical protein Pcinc_023632 [Petrolisthes cinctipes]
MLKSEYIMASCSLSPVSHLIVLFATSLKVSFVCSEAATVALREETSLALLIGLDLPELEATVTSPPSTPPPHAPLFQTEHELRSVDRVVCAEDPELSVFEYHSRVLVERLT